MLVVAPAWTAVDGDHVIVAGLAAAPSWLRQMVPQALEAWYPSVPQALCRVHLSACSHSTWCLCFLTCLSAASRNHPITHPSSAPALRRLRGVWGFDLTRHSTHAAAALRREHGDNVKTRPSSPHPLRVNASRSLLSCCVQENNMLQTSYRHM